MSRLENIDFRKLERILAISGQTIWVVSMRGTVVEVVGSLVDELGYPPGEMIGKPIRDLVHPDDLDETARRFQEVASDSSARNNIETEIRICGVAGEHFEVKVNATAYEHDGHPLEVIALTTDITRQRVAERILRRERARFYRTFEHAPNGILLLHIDPEKGGLVKQANAAACRISGRDQEDLVGRWLSDDDMSEVEQADLLAATAETEAMYRGETQSFEVHRKVEKPDGTHIYIKAEISALEIEPWEMIVEEHPVNAIVHIEDVTARRQADSELQHQARHDSLTDVLNRRSFISILDDRLEGVANGDGAGSLLMIDLDDFKQVNDSFGHEAGDRVLREVANLLKDELRDTDRIARLGGDEFAVLLPQASQEGTGRVADSLVGRFADTRIAIAGEDGESYLPRVSIGVVSLDGRQGDAKAALRLGDQAMYEAKRQGGGRCVIAPD